MNAHLYRRMEIAFWDFFIQTLSENQRVRSIIQQTYRLTHHKDARSLTTLVAACALAGLTSGFVLRALTIYLGN